MACSGSSSGAATDGGKEAGTDAGEASCSDARDAGRHHDGATPSVGCDGSGPPALRSLQVTSASSGDGSSPSTLVPPFSPDIHDYYVRCSAGANLLSVSMNAASNSSSLLVQPSASASRTKQSFSLKVEENQAIVAAATNCSDTTEYWVRCLPHDFPELRWETHAEAGAPAPGYYLVGNYWAMKGESGYAIVLDSNGVPVWYDRQENGYGTFNVDVVDGGGVSFIPAVSPFPYEFHQLGPLATTYAIETDEHEMQLLPNGNYLAFGSPLVAGVDLTALTFPLPDGGTSSFGPNRTIRTCDIGEVDPTTGSLVWHWTGLDHLDPATSRFPLSTGQDAGGQSVVDVFHCNSIDVDPNNGNLLISSRHLDTVFYVEKSTGKILWQMGGATQTMDKETYLPLTGSAAFHRQHDARLQPDWRPSCTGGKGQISMFDDETNTSEVSRGVVYDVNVRFADGGTVGDCGVAVDAGDAGPPGATVAWQYQGTANSIIMGSLRIMPDGSRVIDWGERSSPPNVIFTELDDAGHELLDLAMDSDAGGNFSYRTVKVPPTAFDLNALRCTAGMAGPPGQGSPSKWGGQGGDF